MLEDSWVSSQQRHASGPLHAKFVGYHNVRRLGFMNLPTVLNPEEFILLPDLTEPK